MVNTIIYLLVNSSDPDQYTNFMTNQTLAMVILQNVNSNYYVPATNKKTQGLSLGFSSFY